MVILTVAVLQGYDSLPEGTQALSKRVLQVSALKWSPWIDGW